MHFYCTLPIAKCMVSVTVSVLQCISDCSCTLCTEHLLLHTACTHACSVYAVCMHTSHGSFIIEDIALSTHLLPHHSILNTSLHTKPGQNHHYLHCFFSPNSSAALLCFFTCREFTFSSCEGHVKVIVILLCGYPVCKLQNPKSRA